jgi:hypothetical protein
MKGRILKKMKSEIQLFEITFLHYTMLNPSDLSEQV